MGGRAKRYTKAELIAILEDKCPDALSQFPAPSQFEFKTGSDGDILHVGTTIKTYKSGTEELWVQVHGVCKPFLYYYTVSKRDQCEDPFSFKNRTDYINGNAIFGKLVETGRTLHVYSVELKTLIAFIFVYCDKKTEFPDFDYGKGLPMLISVLEEMAPRFEMEDEVEAEDVDGEGEDAGSEAS
jgi:hypothetical protein